MAVFFMTISRSGRVSWMAVLAQKLNEIGECFGCYFSIGQPTPELLEVAVSDACNADRNLATAVVQRDEDLGSFVAARRDDQVSAISPESARDSGPLVLQLGTSAEIGQRAKLELEGGARGHFPAQARVRLGRLSSTSRRRATLSSVSMCAVAPRMEGRVDLDQGPE